MATADSNLDETCPPPPEQGISRIDASAVEAAEELREALAQYGIAADVHDGYGLALVSVWVDLIVWCREGQFWWRTG
ncbi:hypothetical protein [Streptosporangium sp. CA-115845]|uniref:hypothetical protein n=1 Tax=Streptosporangium sp. CA-115845 TaxID=3240071 RepID=UPI003D8FE119